MKKFKVGFIGCGNNSFHHIKNFRNNPKSEVVSFVDTNSESIKKIKTRLVEVKDIQEFSNHTEMLEKTKPDIVLISTPHTLHYKQIIDSLNADANVLSEKPMVCTSKEAEDVVNLAKKKNKVVTVGYQRRYSPKYAFVKKFIEDGKLGKIEFISALQGQNWLSSQKGKWRQLKSLSGGGQINDSGSHLIDIIFHMTNLSPIKVSAKMNNFGTEVDINTMLSIIFDNNALANISIVGNATTFHEDITIWGTEATIFIRDNLCYHLKGTKQSVVVTELPNVVSMYDDIMNCIETNTKSMSPAEDFFRVIKLTEYAWKSNNENGKFVDG